MNSNSSPAISGSLSQASNSKPSNTVALLSRSSSPVDTTPINVNGAFSAIENLPYTVIPPSPSTVINHVGTLVTNAPPSPAPPPTITVSSFENHPVEARVAEAATAVPPTVPPTPKYPHAGYVQPQIPASPYRMPPPPTPTYSGYQNSYPNPYNSYPNSYTNPYSSPAPAPMPNYAYNPAMYSPPNYSNSGYPPPPPPGYGMYPPPMYGMYPGYPPMPGYNNAMYAQPPIDPDRPCYATMSPQDQEKWMHEFTVRLRILRKSNPDCDYLVDYPENSSLDMIHDIYDNYVRKIMAESSSESYKIFLVILFLGMEVGVSRLLQIDMTGYAKIQIKNMSRYDRLLIELGDKYSGFGKSAWSIEARLFFASGMQAILFVVVKYLSKAINFEGGAEVLYNVLNNALAGKGKKSLPRGGLGAAEEVAASAAAASNPLGGLSSLLQGGINAETLGAFGADIIGKLNNQATTAPATQAKDAAAPKPRRFV